MSTAISGTPRSLAEIEYVAGMHACEGCGDWRPLKWKTGGSGAVWTVRATCPRCSTERMYVFNSAEDLTEAEHPDLELGGPEPSQLLEPFELMREIDRLASTIVLDTSRLVEPEWSANYARLERVQIALAELAKFVPAGADRIPDAAHKSDAARADARQRTERYARAWLESERAHWQATAKQLAKDYPRVVAQASASGKLDRDSLQAHGMWVRRGRTGAGRLEVVGFDGRELKLEGAELSFSRLERVNLSRAALNYLQLAAATLVDVDFSQVRMNSAKLEAAELARCTFDGALLGLSVFDRAVLEQCSLERVWLDRSTWADARVTACDLRYLILGDTLLDGARFADCDLRDGDLKPNHPKIQASSRGTVFERCDFRKADFTGRDLAGARFVTCKFGGAHGKPGKTDGWTVIDADLSADGDGSDLGDATDLLDELIGN